MHGYHYIRCRALSWHVGWRKDESKKIQWPRNRRPERLEGAETNSMVGRYILMAFITSLKLILLQLPTSDYASERGHLSEARVHVGHCGAARCEGDRRKVHGVASRESLSCPDGWSWGVARLANQQGQLRCGILQGRPAATTSPVADMM